MQMPVRLCGFALIAVAICQSAEARDPSVRAGTPRLSDCSTENRAPRIVLSWGQLPCGSQVEVPPEVVVPISFTASDPDPGDVVTLSLTESPVDRTLNTSLPAVGNPAIGDVLLQFRRGDVGPRIVAVEAVDQCGARTECRAYVQIVSANDRPDCSQARASVSELWPPNQALIPVSVLGVTDPDYDPVVITVRSVTQDEPVGGGVNATDCADAVISDGLVSLRAEREGGGNGRVYQIHFEAQDALGAVCEGTVKVCVPRNRGSASECIDDGQEVVSTGSCQGSSSVRLQPGVRRVQAENGVSQIQYDLPEASEVQLAVYDVSGRRLATIDSGSRGPGVVQLSWSGASLPRGIYFLRLRANRTIVTRPVYLGE